MISQDTVETRRAAKAARAKAAPVVVHFCTDRASGEQFYAVPSSNPARQPYKVVWNAERLRWDCPCGDLHTNCRHVRAIREVGSARAAAMRQSA